MQGILQAFSRCMLAAAGSPQAPRRDYNPKEDMRTAGEECSWGARGEITSFGESGVGEAENTTGVAAFKSGRICVGRDEGGHVKRRALRSQRMSPRHRGRDRASSGNGEPSAPAEGTGNIWDNHRGKRLPRQGGTMLWCGLRAPGEVWRFILSSTSSHEPLEIFEDECNII